MLALFTLQSHSAQSVVIEVNVLPSVEANLPTPIAVHLSFGMLLATVQVAKLIANKKSNTSESI